MTQESQRADSTCAYCEQPGVSLLLQPEPQEGYLWLCETHVAQLWEQVETARPLDQFGKTFPGSALLVVEVTLDDVANDAAQTNGQGGTL